MRKLRLLFSLLICGLLFGCSPGVKTIAPPPYPPPSTPSQTGIVTGKIMLQGRLTYEGVGVTLGELEPATTEPDGTYTILDIPPGQHAIRAMREGYLSAEGNVTIAAEGATKAMPTVVLPAGDLNGDETIDLFDLVLISSTFGAQDTAGLRADLNGDGRVDLFDLVLVGNNLYQTGPVAFESP